SWNRQARTNWTTTLSWSARHSRLTDICSMLTEVRLCRVWSFPTPSRAADSLTHCYRSSRGVLHDPQTYRTTITIGLVAACWLTHPHCADRPDCMGRERDD